CRANAFGHLTLCGCSPAKPGVPLLAPSSCRTTSQFHVRQFRNQRRTGGKSCRVYGRRHIWFHELVVRRPSCPCRADFPKERQRMLKVALSPDPDNDRIRTKCLSPNPCI